MIFSHDKGKNMTLPFFDTMKWEIFFQRKSGEILGTPAGFVSELEGNVLMLPVIYHA